MIWVLIISLFLGSGEPLFLIPNLEKSVKKYVTDQERTDQILVIRKENKKHRKEYSKLKGNFEKELKKKCLQKSITKDELTSLKNEFIETAKDYVLKDINYTLETKKLIKEQEWNLIFKNSEKEIKKEIKRVKKIRKEVEKSAFKASKLIDLKPFNKEDHAILKSCINEVFNLRLKHIDTYLNLLEDKESVFYTHNGSSEEFIKTVTGFQVIYDKTVEKIIDTQTISRKVSEKNKWKKLIRKVNLEY